MGAACQTCSKFIPAIKGSVYCSLSHENMDDVPSNSYAFSSINKDSGRHKSRFSVRGITKGQQKFRVNQKDFALDKNNFIILHEGDEYESDFGAEGETDGVILDFNPDFLNDYLHYISHSHEKLLDDPFNKPVSTLRFGRQVFDRSAEFDSVLKTLRQDILSQEKDQFYFHEVFLSTLDKLMEMEGKLDTRIQFIKASKLSTREELYRRISFAKEFIDSHLDEPLPLGKITRIACLSPFHFLRVFTNYYNISPHRYVQNERMRRVNHMIEHSDYGLQYIFNHSGFESLRTFRRVFHRQFGESPAAYIKQKRRKQISNFCPKSCDKPI